MDFRPGLGRLFRLPPEIRAQIWECLTLDVLSGDKISRPASVASKDKNSRPFRLGLLRASREIYEEAWPIIYRDIKLTFEISPQYDHQSWFVIHTNSGLRKTTKNITHALSMSLEELPYSKLKEIAINIEAPDYRDPGQFVSLKKIY